MRTVAIHSRLPTNMLVELDLIPPNSYAIPHRKFIRGNIAV